MEERVISAKTVEEAREIALKELDANPEEVETEILSKGKPGGFLGIGAVPARVRVRRIPSGDNAASISVEVVNRLLAMARVETFTALRTANDPDTGGPIIDITGDDSGLLIGRRGETLRALQFLVNLMVKKRLNDEPVQVVLDIEKYRERRHASLRELALRVADSVANTGRAISLEPMPPAERRIVHMALADHPRVSTQSVGMGEGRQVTVMPKAQ